MTTATREQIVWHWLAFDDKYEALKVNWNSNDPVTQAGMWTVDDTESVIEGIPLIIDRWDHRGYLLKIVESDTDVLSYVAVATYDDKCGECGYQAHDSMWYPDYAGTDEEPEISELDAMRWAVGVLMGMIEHAEATGVERHHFDGCLNGALEQHHQPNEEGEDDE